MVERANMSIINKMHKGLNERHEDSPILSSMPAKKQKKRVLLFILISLLLASSIGLSYLVYEKKNAAEEASNKHKTQLNSSELPLQNVPDKNVNQEVKIATHANAAIKPEVIKPVSPVIQAEESDQAPIDKVQITQTKSIEAPPEKIAVAKPIVKAPVKVNPVVDVPQKTAVVKTPVKETPKIDKNNNIEKKAAHLEIKKSVLTNEQWAEIYLKRAEKALLEGDTQLATKEKLKALTYQPDLHEIRKSLALYYYSLGELAQSENLLKKGAVQFPEHYDFNLMLARIALKSGNQQKAYLYLQQFPPKVEGNIDYHVSYAVLAQKFKHYDRSETLYKGLLTQIPNNGRWRMALAIAQDKQGKKIVAIENYNKALLQVDLSNNAKAYINQRLSYLANQ